MPDLSLLTWSLILAALVIGILAGHFGWGKRWPAPFGKLHPDYLTGLDYLVTEQPDRALDMFLKLMDANADTIETHFALGALYRRRGEVERAIRIHQNLLAREALAPEHREQALLALAQDYLRAGLLDRAEGLFQQVSEVPRLRASALDCAARRLRAPARVAAGARDLSAAGAHQGRAAAARGRPLPVRTRDRSRSSAARSARRADLLRQAREETTPFPRAAVLRAQIAEREGQTELAVRLLRGALRESPKLLQEELPHLLNLVGAPSGAMPCSRSSWRRRSRANRRVEAPGIRGDRRRSGHRRAAARSHRDGVRRRMRR